MDEALAAVVTGTVVHVDAHVLVVPSRPPAPRHLPRSAELREQLLAGTMGWTPADDASAAGARRTHLADLRAGRASVVELHGADLPADGVRVRLRGTLTGRSLQVSGWSPEPDATSAWAAPRVAGTDAQTAEAIVDGVPEGWPLISFGVSTTTAGRSAVQLEVERLTPEIEAWFDRQPPGSVQLDVFVHGAAAAGASPG